MAWKYLASVITAIAPALGNHLWQSTLFSVAAGLLTLTLRKNHAGIRYALWLTASIKFLIPFSLLAGMGSYLGWLRSSAATKASLYSTIEEVSLPFTRPDLSTPSLGNHSAASLYSLHLLPFMLVALWFAGFVAVATIWCTRWRRISAAMREAVPLGEGREVEVLRRLEHQGIGTPTKPIEILESRASLEPGVFGIARPVLLWPTGISECLKDDHLEAILVHELWHVRRRDNLAAAMHMLVEAIFWFHPVVWWLEARLVEERERACDEEVLHFGKRPEVYAESILRVCEFCLGYSLVCVSGVTGADLKKRIVRIMTEAIVPKLDLSRKLLLGAAAVVVVALPMAFGIVNATPSRAASQDQDTTAAAHVYDVASIKPNKSGTNMVRLMFTPDGLTAMNGTLEMFINAAYAVDDNQIFGGPSWLKSDHYDIEAKMESATANALHKLSEDQARLERQRMLQALLADRFMLTVHRETRELPLLALVVAKDGPKFREAKPGDTYPNGIKGPEGHSGAGMMIGSREGLTAQGVLISNFAAHLSRLLGREVVDKTGLTGRYDFTLQWTPDESQGAMLKGLGPGPQSTGSPPPPDASGPSIFTALQEELGLKLESQKGPVEVLVIDHAEKPSEN